jgi:hypothetical protein
MGYKVVYHIVHCKNSYHCLFQELSTNRLKKRHDALTGAPSPADIDDPYIQEIANAALAEVDRRSNALYRQKVVRIVKAQKQVISVYSWFQTFTLI